jgi:hypothetical protein
LVTYVPSQGGMNHEGFNIVDFDDDDDSDPDVLGASQLQDVPLLPLSQEVPDFSMQVQRNFYPPHLP